MITASLVTRVAKLVRALQPEGPHAITVVRRATADDALPDTEGAAIAIVATIERFCRPVGVRDAEVRRCGVDYLA